MPNNMTRRESRYRTQRRRRIEPHNPGTTQEAAAARAQERRAEDPVNPARQTWTEEGYIQDSIEALYK